MGLPCWSIVRGLPHNSKLVNSQANLQLFSHLKNIIILILFDLLLLPIKALCDHLIKRDHDHDRHHNHDRDDLPNNYSASLLPVPVHHFAKSAIKKQLPAVRYGSLILERIGMINESSCGDDHRDLCIVCINQIEEGHEVRLLKNCSHVFHKDCLDAWVDQGQGTCPLCRSKLLTPQNHDHHDPSRMDRMIYLFGDDYLFL